MRVSRFFRPAFASLLALATLVAYTGLSVPPNTANAVQDDQPTLDVIAGLNETLGFVGSLGAVGALAEPVPGLALAPGSAAGIGLGDLLTSGRDTLLGGATYGGVNSLSDLVEAIDDVDDASLGDGRTLDLTASDAVVGDRHTITLGFTGSRAVDTGVDILSTSPKLSFTAADGIRADIVVTGSLVLVYDESDRYFRIRKDSTSPSLGLTLNTSIPDLTAVSAGLGILGVGLGAGSTYDLSAALTATFDDPDSDGELAFDEPDGAGGFRDGELAAEGVGAGIAGVNLTSGALSSTLNLTALPSPHINLGTANAQVTVGSPNLLTTPITVTDTGGTLGAVNNFLNLSPRDLAQGLAEIATTLVALQRAGGADLPFLRGSVADAVSSTEAIVEFLEEHVTASTDPATPGRPDFASIQELLQLLVDATPLDGDVDFSVANGTYDGSKLRFDLSVEREPGTAQPLNALGAATSSDGTGVTYTPTSVTDPNQNFSDQDGEALSYQGRQILVGSSSAIIASASGSTLTLDPGAIGQPVGGNAWKGGTPANGSAYSVSAGDPRTGVVELGNVLGTDGAIKNANARTAVATVTPSYSVTLPIVLDLRPGSTTDCDPGPGTGCPFQLIDPDTGVATLITELPLPPDRIMLRTGQSLLTADAPISTAVDVDATVGFVGVKVTGQLRVCTDGAPVDCSGAAPEGNHLFTLGLAPRGDSDGDATLPEIVRALTDALRIGTEAAIDGVVTGAVTGQAYASLQVDVPGANGFFGSAPAAATITLTDITDVDSATVNAPDLAKLVPLDFDPDNPLALFGVLLADLQAVQDLVSDLPGGSAALDTRIPLVGRSLSDLIGSGVSGAGGTVTYTPTALTDTSRTFDLSFLGRRVTVGTTTAVVVGAAGNTLALSPWNVEPADGAAYEIDSELQGVINLLTAAPPASLQDALALLANGLGIDTDPGEALGFTVDAAGGNPVLRLDVDWVRQVQKTLPVNLTFDLGGADKSLVGADSSGVLNTTVGGEISLGLELPLTEAAAAAPVSSLRIDPASTIKASASLTGTGVRLATNIGPFQISLGNPDLAQPAGTQLEADFGVALADTDPTHTGPVTLSDFADSLSLTMDNGTVSCPGDGTDVELSACAVLPVYLNGTPVSATDNAFLLRLPKQATDLADAFSLSGDIESGVARFDYPPDLADKLALAGLNMLTVGDGLFAYIEFLENALHVASFDGKLPLVGKDLQAGSAFLAELRTGLESAFAGAPTDPTAGDIREFLDTQVAPHLPGVTAPLPIEFECNVFLSTPHRPGVTPTNDGDEAMPYEYKIVATVNDPSEDGVPSEASHVVRNAAVLDATHFNQVSWVKVDFATGYKILRKRGVETDFTQVGTAPQSDSPTFKDVAAAGTPYGPASTENPKVHPCPDGASAELVTGFSVSVDLQQGDPTAANGCVTDCLESSVPLDLGIPGLSFKASDSANDKIQAKLGWSLHLEFGLNRDDGFFVRTQDATTPEFIVGASLDLPTDMQAQLAFFEIDIDKHAGSTAPLFHGAFAIDIKDEPNAPDCHTACTEADPSRMLTLDSLKASSLGDLVAPRLDAGVNIDWDVKATVDSALPGIGARFLLAWEWNSDDPSNVTNLTELAFKEVVIDPGQFIEGNIGPIVDQIISVFKPILPIIDTITAPLPVLSDLSKLAGGGDVTIASLADDFSTLAGGPDIDPFIEVIKVIKTLSGLVGDCGGGTFCVTLGDFDIKKELALNTANSAATAGSLVGPTENTPSEENNPFKQLSGFSGSKLENAEGPALADAACPNGKRGISFPALEQPTSMFGLLLNQDVEIACFDSGPLSLGFEMNLRLGPVYAPPPVYIVISGGASVSLRIAAGFDTYGIRTAVEQGKLTANILDSIYFKTTATTGAPLPVVQFKGFLAAGASVSAVVIEVGVKGGIELTVMFTWNDPNNDGKFRFNEFLATALNNPICLFNVGGQLDLFITVFITLGIDPFSVSFDFELVRVKLLDFSLKPNCTPPPPRLGGTDEDGTLYLFAGKYSSATERGHDAWKSSNTADEGWIIRQVPDDADTTDTDESAVVVQALGITETFPDAGGTAIDTVVLDGRGYAGKLKVIFNGGAKDEPFDKETIVFSGSGNDTIRTGSGDSFVDAGPGDDNVSTTDRPNLAVPAGDSGRAVVAGGTGADGITVGNGIDVVLGDRFLNRQVGDVTVTPLTGAPLMLDDAILAGTVSAPVFAGGEDSNAGDGNGVDGADIISAGLGGSQIWGGGGADVIGTANDSPLAQLPANASTKQQYVAQWNKIVGGSGGDRIKSGSGADQIYTGSSVAPGKDGLGSGDADTDVNTVDTGTGSDTVYGSNGQDNVTTGSFADQSAKVYAAGANDIITGGDGSDELYGGPGDDYVIAEPSTVDTDPLHAVPDVLGSAYAVKRLNRPSSDSPKTLAGGGGRDRIYGGNGTALIYGDRDDFTCAKGSDPLSDAPTEAPTVSDPANPAIDDAADLILGGEGVDKVNAGGGNDHVDAKGGDDLLCGNADNDRISAGAGTDHVYGGTGNDTAYGDGGDDLVFGNDGTDTLYGGADADVLEGNAGSDTAFGGTQADVVVGGTRKAARADIGDTLYGDSGQDTLIGDNGIPEELFDLGSSDANLGGQDLLWGGAHDDKGYGGLDDDEVHGGDGNDHLEGNNASDEVFGENGADNMIGGTSQLATGDVSFPDAGDKLYGGNQDDVVTGDNARLTSVASGGTDITQGRGLSFERLIQLYDLEHSSDAMKSGEDEIHGGADSDVLLGQGANDTVRGESGDDYAEGGQADDTIYGGAGEDDLVGGGHVVHQGSGQGRVGQLDGEDTVYGGDAGDIGLGDNGKVLRGTEDNSDVTESRGQMTPRLIELYDLGDAPTAGTSGRDWLLGEGSADVLLGQSGNDRVTGGADEDYAEGGPGSDWVEGNGGDDDLVGGSSTTLGDNTGRTAVGQLDAADVVWGGGDDDLVLGDNAVVSRVGTPHELTDRIGTNPPATTTDRRAIQLLDLVNSGDTLAEPAGRFGGDYLSGQGGVDVLLGQDGPDVMSGGSDDDYAEGHGGGDSIVGDVALAEVLALPAPGWPGTPSDGYAADVGAHGQDDLLGGKSEAGFRDGNDTISGNGASDFVLGDNGTAVRDTSGAEGSRADRLYSLRYASPTPVGAAKIRVADSGFPSTRFCSASLPACERTGAYGGDFLFGDGGDDFLYGQDGNDAIRGGSEDDDIYGELGNDTLFGEAGDDAILGDRGGVRDRYETGSSRFNLSVTQVPKVSYEGFSPGSVTRITDLLHDVDGDEFVGSGATEKMPHNGRDEGGNDRIRGGLDDDSIHAGFGDDLANGDSGGDIVFGDDGADVLWGGKGCDAQADTVVTKPYCYAADGTFDPAPHQADGSTVPAVTDYLLGGKGGTSQASLDGALGSDILDWRPRGSYTPGTGCTTNDWPSDLAPLGKQGVSTTIDPCSWFEMTDIHNDVVDDAATTADNQHHQGIDWQYGGWDRDVLQGDEADNGPNEGDRLLDWDGAYNLYTHCNAAYGGFNDVRQHSPTWQDFLQRMVFGLGAGQAAADATAEDTSSFVELALVYPGKDREHGSGRAYPATPGHFDDPNACAP